MCDCVRFEAGKLLKLSQKFKKQLSSSQILLLNEFLNSFPFPKFSAEGFFSLKKSTIFSILNTITTLLIVMIQFDKEKDFGLT